MPTNTLDLELNSRLESLLRRTSETPSGYTIPPGYDLRSERQRAAQLHAYGLLDVIDPSGPTYACNAEGHKWLEFLGKDEREPEPLEQIVSRPVLDQIRAIAIEISDEVEVTDETVAERLIVLGLQAFARLRADNPTPVVEYAHHEGGVRTVGGLLVWADVAAAVGAKNAKTLADTYNVRLLPLPPSDLGRGQPGRTPTQGIAPADLDKLEGRWPLEIHRVREALVGDPTGTADPYEDIPDHMGGLFVQALPGVYAIKCIDDGSVYVGASNNMRQRAHIHRSKLRGDLHNCRTLQDAWNTYGEKAFRFVALQTFESEPESAVLAAAEAEEHAKALEESNKHTPPFTLHGFRSRRVGPGPGTRTVKQRPAPTENPNQPGVFWIRHLDSKSAFVNVSKNVATATAQHKWHLRHGSHRCKPLQDAWNEHGEGAFAFEFKRAVTETQVLATRGVAIAEAIGEGMKIYNLG